MEGRSFTARGVGVGLAIGLVLACTNISMGLQSGWISTMTMPASLMGFGFFRLVSRHLKFPFSPVENVLVQTVAGSMGIMPLGCGLVGVVPAMNFLLTKDENGPLNLSLWQLVIWSLGVCYFGVLFAVPLYVTPLRSPLGGRRTTHPPCQEHELTMSKTAPSHHSGAAEVPQRLQHRGAHQHAARSRDQREGVWTSRLDSRWFCEPCCCQ